MVIKRIVVITAGAAALAVGAAAGPAAADTNATTPSGTAYPVVRQGTTSETVRSLQWLLNCKGISVAVPSHFGPKTYAAVQTYQRHHGLYADGNVGATTWNDLFSRSQVRYGDRNDCVKALQVQLNTYREDTHTGDLPITGYFGPKTRTALHNFQTWRHRPATDTADVATWNALLTSGIGE